LGPAGSGRLSVGAQAAATRAAARAAVAGAYRRRRSPQRGEGRPALSIDRWSPHVAVEVCAFQFAPSAAPYLIVKVAVRSFALSPGLRGMVQVCTMGMAPPRLQFTAPSGGPAADSSQTYADHATGGALKSVVAR